MEKVVEFAKDYYKKDKPILKLKQKLLLKKYLITVQMYSMLCEQSYLEGNFVIDDLIIMNRIHLIHSRLRDSFDDMYPSDIDNRKFEEAKELVADEINRLNLVMINIVSSDGSYVPNYSDDEIKLYFKDSDNLEYIIELNKKIKSNSEVLSLDEKIYNKK